MIGEFKLLKQKGRIEEEQAKVKASQELDSKIKAERLKSLTTEQQTIEAQIAQIRMEQAQNRKNGSSPSAESRDPKLDRSSDSSMKDIVRADALHGQLKKMTQVRGKLEVAANNLQSEVRLGRLQFELGPANDSGRGQMLENAEQSVFKPKLEQETALKAKISSLDGKIGETMAEAQKTDRKKEETDKAEDGTRAETVAPNRDQSLSEADALTREREEPGTSRRQEQGGGLHSKRIDVRI